MTRTDGPTWAEMGPWQSEAEPGLGWQGQSVHKCFHSGYYGPKGLNGI